MSAPSPPSVDLDDGVIEEARRRQRRRRLGLAGWLSAAAALAAVMLILLGNGSGGAARSPGDPTSYVGTPFRLAVVHGLANVNGKPVALAVRSSLQVAEDGLLVQGPDGDPGTDIAYPSARTTLWGITGIRLDLPRSAIGYVLTGPAVAAVRVNGVGTFRPLSLVGLPPQTRAVLFAYRPPGVVVPPGLSVAMVRGIVGARRFRPITFTALDALGRVLPTVVPGSTVRSNPPVTVWRGQPSAWARRTGRCAVSSKAPGVRVQWGEVATAINPDPSATRAALLTCLQEWFVLPGGAAFETAILLNATHPGAFPAPLWATQPVAGQRDIVQIRPTPTAPEVLARRVGAAWLLVENGTLQQRLAVLKSLHITRLAVRPRH